MNRSTLVRRSLATAAVVALAVTPLSSGASAASSEKASLSASVKAKFASAPQIPLRGVILVAEPVHDGYPTVVFKGSDDTGTINRVAAGRLYNTAYRLQYFDDSDEFMPAGSRVIRMNGRETFQQTMVRAWNSDGVVLSPRGVPMAGVDVWSIYDGPDGSEYISTKTASDGSFSLSGIPEGIDLDAGYGYKDVNSYGAQAPGGNSADVFPTASPRQIELLPKPRVSLTVATYGTGAAKVTASVSFPETPADGVLTTYDGTKSVVAKAPLVMDGNVGRWSYIVKGLKRGKHSIKVRYYGNEGELQGGDSVRRTVTVK